MLSISQTAQCLVHVEQVMEMTFDDVLTAYEQADIFTALGFEVSSPRSLDGGESYTIAVQQG